MANERIIRFRVSDAFYDTVLQKVDEKGITISDFVRDELYRAVELRKDPLHSTDLLFVFAYLENYRNTPKSVCTYEIKHLLDIIKRHYPYLEYELQKVFDKLILGLKNILGDMKMYKDADDFTLSLGEGKRDINFDYDTFYEYTNGRLPYR
jgi:hypothetical protein